MRILNKHRTIYDRDDRNRPSLNLLVSGFSRQSRVGIEDISAVVDALPASHLTGLDEIIYDPDWETSTALALQNSHCPRRSKAVYLRGKRRVLVFRFDDLEQLRHILCHEIGHHVFDRVLASKLRKEWVTVINPRSRYVTRYAMRNALEDFAESYAVFVLDPKAMLAHRKKYKFIRDRVFAGVACNVQQGHIDAYV